MGLVFDVDATMHPEQPCVYAQSFLTRIFTLVFSFFLSLRKHATIHFGVIYATIQINYFFLHLFCDS
jgi:hypothetical protein